MQGSEYINVSFLYHTLYTYCSKNAAKAVTDNEEDKNERKENT